MKQLLEWFKENGTPQQVFWITVAAVAGAVIMGLSSSCQTAHGVMQTAATSTYKVGDTTVVKTEIEYKQEGSIKK